MWSHIMRNLQPRLATAQKGTTSATQTRMAAVTPVTMASADRQVSATPVADEMMTLAATCAFFGGDKPLNPSTLYRGIAVKRFPKPVHVAPNSSRWLRSECEAARKALIAARDGG